MSIFRVEKNKNYTVMSNYHLRDKNLSLRTIGLLSLILSLPDNWDYSQAGLAAICKDGEDSIRSGLKELEKHGYLVRERERDESGRMRGTIYHIFETPNNKLSDTTVGEDTSELPRVENPILEKPMSENPMLENPKMENSNQEKPMLAKQPQINKETEIKDRPNTDVITNDLLIINQSINRSMDDGKVKERDILKQQIYKNISYDFFIKKMESAEYKFENNLIGIDEYEHEVNSYNIKTVDKVVQYVLDVLLSLNSEPIQIGDDLIDRGVVKEKLMDISILDVKKVVYTLNTMDINNPKKYTISMLYNS